MALINMDAVQVSKRGGGKSGPKPLSTTEGFTILAAPTGTLQKQAVICLQILNRNISEDSPYLSEADFAAELECAKETGELVTKQDPYSRVFGFYRKTLTDAGVIAHGKV